MIGEMIDARMINTIQVLEGPKERALGQATPAQKENGKKVFGYRESNPGLL